LVNARHQTVVIHEAHKLLEVNQPIS